MSPARTPISRWSDAFLDSMRQATDPEPDALVAEIFEQGGEEALLALRKFLDHWDAPITPSLPPRLWEFFERPVAYPSFVDFAKIDKASDLFVSYGPVTTVTLLLNSVPHFFTNPAGARAFYLAKIFSPESVRTRMREVPQFVINITMHDGLRQKGSQKGPGILSAQKLRLAHAAIRLRLKIQHPEPEKNWDLATLGEPINQEDLAEALMDFCLWTIEGLKKVGIDQTLEEQEATLMAWRAVGFLLGLRDELQPQNIEEARLLRQTTARRHARGTPEAAALIQDMLQIMEGMLPRLHRCWPAGLMRYQLGDETADMVQVPELPLVVWLLTALKPVWEEKKIFARFARLVSPHIVHWLIWEKTARGRGPFHLPPLLAKSWGLSGN